MPKYEDTANNVLYVASDKLAIPGLDHLNIQGAGMFDRMATARVLTASGMSRRHWRVPKWLHNDGQPQLSYHANPSLWIDEGDSALVRSAAIGQEFVLNPPSVVEPALWLQDIFGGSP